MKRYLPYLINLVLLITTLLPARAAIAAEYAYLNPEEGLKLESKSGHYLAASSSNPFELYLERFSFDLLNRQIATSYPSKIHYQSRNTAQSFSLKNWDHEYLPVLNGTPLDLNGKSLVTAISDNEKQFILVSDKESVLYTASGQRIWTHPETDTAINVIITPDQQYVITRFTNGVIRWQNLSDGQTLFSVFIKTPSLKWIIWNPDGLFDSSDPDFNPLLYLSKKGNILPLSDLQFKFFSPDKIQELFTGKTLSVKPDQQSVPKIEFQSRLFDQANLCIHSEVKDDLETFISINDVTVKSFLLTPDKYTALSKCQFEVLYQLKPFHNINKVSAKVRDLKTQLESSTADQQLDFASIEPPNSTNRFFILNNVKNNAKFIERFESQTKDKAIVEFSPASLKSLNNKINPEKLISYTLILSAYCERTENDLLFKDSSSASPFWSLNQLKRKLQNQNILMSQLLVDCMGSEKNFDKLKLKKLIFPFFYDTGRSALFHFSVNSQPARNQADLTIMQRLILRASTGEADYNDDLVISNQELLKYLNQNIQLETFESRGKQAIVFSHDNPLTRFNLPVLIKD